MKKIRESKFSKIVAYYLIIMMILQITQPMQMYALTGGPTQPEFNSFTPIGTSDMVDLASGDFNYNIPIMDVGGYPLNLAYNSGVTMDQEASWTGLGWDMSVGQIARQVRGLPDDFNGDKMIYENNMKPNTTIGSNFNVFLAPFGVAENIKVKANVGLGVKYNNYDGVGFAVSGGLSYEIGNNLSVGMNLESSSTDGVSASPSVSLHAKVTDKDNENRSIGASLGVSLNSRKGIESMTMSASYSRVDKASVNGTGKKSDTDAVRKGDSGSSSGASIGGGSVSYNDASYTPSKRIGMSSENTMFSLNVEGAVYGVDPGTKSSGYRNTQGIKDSEKYKFERGFGYENTTNASQFDVLDFNREKDRTVNKNTISLPITNYTHDLYSIQGQGIGGMFRPYRSQVGYVFDNYVRDDSEGLNLGGEIGGGAGTHFGFDGDFTESKSTTGLWINTALNRFQEKKSGNTPNYEKVFFKNIGGNHVDKDLKELLTYRLGGYDPISLKITEDNSFSRDTDPSYYDKFLINRITSGYQPYIKRGAFRLNRGQTIQKITREEAYKFGTRSFSPYTNRRLHKNHTSEIRIIKDGGERYNYARAAYNIVKKEVTFDVSNEKNPLKEVNCDKGYVNYTPGQDNSASNNKDGDQYFNRITTPAYAHTFLLTSILSPDYQDKDGKSGATDGDLGSYTKFTYTTKNAKKPYKWRVPYGLNTANFDEGLKSLNKDNKANYQYGEKEQLYISKIETKTHIAIFSISPRNDGLGVIDENGGMSTLESSKMWKLDKISLYSKPEYEANPENATPIKVAHFEYDYSLCQGIDNNINKNNSEFIGQQGKLTLKKLYFTYRNSNMGKYTPYKFNYGKENQNISGYTIENDKISNPDYDQRAYDIWGYYKPNTGAGCNILNPLSNAEFPYVDQSNKPNADNYASAWLLKSINLPSGGQMDVEFESDDYGSVQNKDVMQMFKVVGAGNKPNPSSDELTKNKLYDLGLDSGSPFSILPENQTDYLYFKLDKPCANVDFYRKYILKLIGQHIYFRFLLNMTKPTLSDKYDYVTGYLDLAKDGHNTFINLADNQQYAAIRILTVNRGDGLLGSNQVNPISKAGWIFGRQNLNALMYNLKGVETLDINDVEAVVLALIDLAPNILSIFKSPNSQLIEKQIARNFIPQKSWIRLMQPESKKLGGGSRVKGIKIKDKWDVMTNHLGNEVYAQFYGQQYSYTEEDNVNSSGVATYEPLGSKENPFVQPHYDRAHKESLLGGDVQNYVELPLGESFFPAPKITYGRVTVKNLPREKSQNNNGTQEVITVKKHATGRVVSEFYTSKDYPTISDFSLISSKFDNSDIGDIINLNVKSHLALSQGFSIHTNDMDGKAKSQWVYAEDQSNAISGMEYKYDSSGNNSPNQGKLNNNVTTINSKGEIKENVVGVDYDVVNDFRENSSETETSGIRFNTEGLPLALIFLIVPVPLPNFSHHENVLKMATTTKVIHSTGILRETVAYDLGSKVSNRNLAWDADSGAVILTETINEYNDKYFNFNFPAYWAYDGMSQAALNLGLEWGISKTAGTKYKFNDTYDAKDYLIDGDELWVNPTLPTDVRGKGFKAWAVNVTGNSFDLIDAKGVKVIDEANVNNPKAKVILSGNIKVTKSGHKNMATASMASITLMKNPLIGNTIINQNTFLTDSLIDHKIVNASAVEYKDKWPSQCECGLPQMIYDNNGLLKFEYDQDSKDDFDIIEKRSFNPYLNNILGNWRAVKSYAYLTGRNNSSQTPRISGFFNDFRSFYDYNLINKQWETTKNPDSYTKWTFASEVSQYNAWGQEVENKDALLRYSSALYGYNNRFPVAVASNTQYKELASDGFEDYDFSKCDTKSHFSFEGALLKNKVSITNKQSHTGRRSIRLEPKAATTIQKKIVNCGLKATSTTPVQVLKK
jgi:hypothetical protein